MDKHTTNSSCLSLPRVSTASEALSQATSLENLDDQLVSTHGSLVRGHRGYACDCLRDGGMGQQIKGHKGTK